MNIEDRLAILETIANYSYRYDAQDPVGFSELFVEDALWEAYAANAQKPELQLSGRAGIREWAAARLARRAGKFTSRHHQSGTVFESWTADGAKTRTMVLVTHQGTDEAAPSPTLSGVYHDVWRRTPQGWRFAHRALHHDRHGVHVQS
ncbi:SnoaL-like protein [Panacagrimonas perspica]|uniref:SnoaL-like protein n=1 Tax=Panacagrimonas perspica TaxID=381431 RepID=A0A4S3K7M9_9GAMM|nr:nuclear transport factor 2 family protein [Panacagrimonas perspica]TDU31903.1 SnoaL-like protein [Panacagrimonas perspica]THD04225.1 hypothetical protein B1810_06200 [Panacagrimonas perspica]